ncbi:hypothetical protein [Paraburkholderia domus]|uniref:hypothetical protein n=1 Tax=Paraburkholderia domus TaxID=2793075 RepID=UPI001B8B0D66|nr:hypothetical protein [Paraburkholderia domus]
MRWADRPNMELVLTADGKRKWKLSAEALAEVRRRISASHALGDIVRSMHVSHAMVTKIAREMRAAAPAPAAAEKEKDAEAPLSLVPKPDQAPPDPATPDPATPDLPYHAIASPKADEPAMSTTCGPQLGYQEPVRTFVIDWKAKFDRMEFTSAPANCLPKKSRTHRRGLTHDQLNRFIRSDRGPTAGMSINSKPKPVQSIASLFAGSSN